MIIAICTALIFLFCSIKSFKDLRVSI